MNEKLNPVDGCSAVVIRGGYQEETAGAHGHFDVVCFRPDGSIRWVDVVENTVMNQGKAYMLDNALAGSSFTTLGPQISLIANAGFVNPPAATNTYATHADFAESTAVAARLPLTSWASAVGGSKAANAVTFTMTGSDTIIGCAVFFTTSTVIGNATNDASHLLLSAGAFTGGAKTVSAGPPADTIQITYTFSI